MHPKVAFFFAFFFIAACSTSFKSHENGPCRQFVGLPEQLPLHDDNLLQARDDFQSLIYGAWPAIEVEKVTARELPEGITKFEIEIGGRAPVSIEAWLKMPAHETVSQNIVVHQSHRALCTLFTSTGSTSTCKSPSRSENFAPSEYYLDNDIGYAAFHASRFITDSPTGALNFLENQDLLNADNQPGLLILWAAATSVIVNTVKSKHPNAKVSVLGFSRHAKSVLLAGAFNPQIDTVIAHQSGTGGAALWRSSRGEGFERVAAGAGFFDYSHWFTPRFRAFAKSDIEFLPIDQHQLLALIAPRNVILGIGLRDAWSDPISTTCSASLASHAWGNSNNRGFSRESSLETDLSQQPAIFFRPGGHALTRQDHHFYSRYIESLWDDDQSGAQRLIPRDVDQ